MWAITGFEVGEPVTARAIDAEWDLLEGETFKAETWSPDMVLAADGVSLRYLTVQEMNALAVAEQRNAIKAQIEEIERNDLMNRRAREAFLLQAEQIAADQYGLTPEQLYAVNPGYKGAKDVDNEVKALRALL